jgi:hypothetical protein
MELRNSFIEEVKKLIEDSRVNAIRSVDHIRVRMYWELGRKIVEEEQSGNKRAHYGSYLIISLSTQLVSLYGEAFSKRQLERYRQFYRFFPIASALRTQLTWTYLK